MLSATVSANVTPVKSFTYDAIGNLLTKSDSTSFTYDANGNQTAGLGCSIGYTSYNKSASITQGSNTLFFSHDADHQP